MRYERVPLEVKALFLKDGRFIPRAVYFDGVAYDISHILSVNRHCPLVVGCIAPVEYTVLIGEREKKLYFEPDSNKWFSIKEV